MAITKTLLSARPTVSSQTGNVVNWDIEATLSEDGFERNYSYFKDVSAEGKLPGDFTKADLLSYAPAVLDEVFSHHKEVSSASYTPPTQTDNSFDVNSLG